MNTIELKKIAVISGDVFECRIELQKYIDTLTIGNFFYLDINDDFETLKNITQQHSDKESVLILNNFGLQFNGEKQREAFEYILNTTAKSNFKILIITSSAFILDVIVFNLLTSYKTIIPNTILNDTHCMDFVCYSITKTNIEPVIAFSNIIHLNNNLKLPFSNLKNDINDFLGC